LSGNLLQHHHEARLLAGLVHQVRHRVVQGVEILAEVGWKRELLGDEVQHVLLALGRRQVGV
jgi:hypothetical protein